MLRRAEAAGCGLAEPCGTLGRGARGLREGATGTADFRARVLRGENPLGLDAHVGEHGLEVRVPVVDAHAGHDVAFGAQQVCDGAHEVLGLHLPATVRAIGDDERGTADRHTAVRELLDLLSQRGEQDRGFVVERRASRCAEVRRGETRGVVEQHVRREHVRAVHTRVQVADHHKDVARIVGTLHGVEDEIHPIAHMLLIVATRDGSRVVDEHFKEEHLARRHIVDRDTQTFIDLSPQVINVERRDRCRGHIARRKRNRERHCLLRWLRDMTWQPRGCTEKTYRRPRMFRSPISPEKDKRIHVTRRGTRPAPARTTSVIQSGGLAQNKTFRRSQ